MFAQVIFSPGQHERCVCRSEGMEGGEVSTLNIAVVFNLSHNARDRARSLVHAKQAIYR